MNSVKELVSTKPGEKFRDLAHCHVGLPNYSKIQLTLELLPTNRFLVFPLINGVVKVELRNIITAREET